MIHTVVDGGVDRLVDMGEQQFDNPLIDAAIIGVGHKIKNKLHDRINDFGEDETSESVDETGENLSSIYSTRHDKQESALMLLEAYSKLIC